METTPTVPVTTDNFLRAESDLYFSRLVQEGGLGRFEHHREPAPIDEQTVVRMNRDTLYSSGIFDLDAGPVTVTLPDAGARFMSMQAIDEDEYVPEVVYGAGSYTYTRETVGTRYVLLAVRTLVDPDDPDDVEDAHMLQDAITSVQPGHGRFEVPNWDQATQKRVRDSLMALSSTMSDSTKMFGRRDEVDPVRHLIGAAYGWGGNPEKDATYLSVTPSKNDGTTVHRLVVKDVPVDGFWSISVYNADGYFQRNKENAYAVNNLTAKKAPDGTVTVLFGGHDPAANCLPIMPGWNYTVRLYRPRKDITDGSWRFPVAQPVKDA